MQSHAGREALGEEPLGSVGRDAGRQQMRLEYKGGKDVAVNGRTSRGARRGKGDSVQKQGSRPGEYTEEESVGCENFAKPRCGWDT